MTLDHLDTKLRRYETAHDHAVLPGLYMVARLDGRGFTRLTRETLTLDAPFDIRFRDWMVATTRHLMAECGSRIIHGHTHSDEISLLFHPDADAFGRKLRKLLSVLAGEASASFSLAAGAHGAFDARISQLPTPELVADYFRWRSGDAHRCAINGHAYWTLRHQGRSAREATKALTGLRTADLNELLFQAGTNVNDLPAWQKRGVDLTWRTVSSQGVDPRDGSIRDATRSELVVDEAPPYGDELAQRLSALLSAPEHQSSV